MYYFYCALISMYMGVIYELTGLESFSLENFIIAFLLLFPLQLIFNSSKKYHCLVLSINFLIFHFLAIANLLKVHFQLAEITFFDFKLIENTAAVAHLFIYKLPFKEIFSIIIIAFIALFCFCRLYQQQLKKFTFSKLKAFIFAFFIFVSPFFIYAQDYPIHSSFFHFLDSGKNAFELFINDKFNLTTAKTDLNKHPLSRLDKTDPLLTGYPFTQQKSIDVIIIQSETFFDAKKNQQHFGKNGIKIKQNITDIFQNYQNKGISGTLFVPTVGGATVNTEYEVMTGYSAKAFAKGSIVFTSILEKDTASLANFIKNNVANTATVGIHNHTRTYWDRDRVYPLLSIDKYIAMDDFSHEAQNDLVGAWMSDETLFNKVLETLNNEEKTKNHFILAVTSQNHGPFLEKFGKAVTIEGLPQEDIWEITNYFTNLKYSDESLERFMNVIDKRKKPTMVIFYGDHKPDPRYKIFTESDYYTKDNYQNLYSTDYFIYFNPMIKDVKLSALKGLKKDLSATGLNRYIQILLGDRSKESLFIYNVTKNPDNYFNTEKENKSATTLYKALSKQSINNLDKENTKS